MSLTVVAPGFTASAPQPAPRLYTEAEVTRMLAVAERAAIETVMARFGLSVESAPPRHLSVVQP